MPEARPVPVYAWAPILTDEPGRQAIDTARAIAATLQSVAEGECWWETALLDSYLAELDGDREAGESALARLFRAIPAFPNAGALGLAGFGWTVQHLRRNVSAGEDRTVIDAVLQAIDGRLSEALVQESWPGTCDLDSGLIGAGTYFLERLNSADVRPALEAIVGHLSRLAESCAQGITWRADPESLGIPEHELRSGVYCGLGLFQGVPGIVRFLVECRTAGISCERCEQLVEGAVRWLFAQAQPAEGVARFGPWSVDNVSPVSSRLAWCHGDLGISTVLFHAARRLGRWEWRRSAEALLEHCLDWPADLSGVTDPSLCHGSAGVAHVFNRMYQEEGNERCLRAAQAWFDWTLKTMLPSPHDLTPSLRLGATGVALALLAAATPRAPEWDRIMLLSGRSWSGGTTA